MQRMTLGVLSGLILAGLPPASPQEMPNPTATSAGNLSANFYPKSGCEKPDKPPLPKLDYDDRAGRVIYNSAVKRYNTQLQAFVACTGVYVAEASTDIDWILFAANTPVATVNGLSPPIPPAALGNMPSGFYPPPGCIAPNQQLGAPPNVHDIEAMKARNTKVKIFNVLAASFSECLKAYVARAHVDIQRIEEAQRAAASEASGQ